MNGKIPAFLTILGMVALVAAVLTFQPYSADWPAKTFTQPARNYLRAALRQDSVGLRRLSTSARAPVCGSRQSGAGRGGEIGLLRSYLDPPL